MSDDEKPRRLVFTKEDIEKFTRALRAYLENAKASCALLVDAEGHILVKEGETSTYPADTLATLVAFNVESARRTAGLLGDKEFSVLYHQEGRENLQLTLTGRWGVLAVVFDDKTTLGMVRLYGSVLSSKLKELFTEIANRKPPA